MSPVRTRLAPSPTGSLHLGNAWSFLLCWLAARAASGQVFLRIDDLDPQRSKLDFAKDIIEDLQWLGLDWDNCGNESVIFQSARNDVYNLALQRLERKNLVYPCFCTRKELRLLASAPHVGDEGVFYPGICANLDSAGRKRRILAGAAFSLRLRCPEKNISFADLVQGPQSFTKEQYGGDFPLRRSDGVWAYQLASAVDDAEMGVNLVMRGRDLLPSTSRQIILAQHLGYQQPTYAHIPLLLDKNGERLAKRHASLSIASMRKGGADAGRIIGYLGFLAGFNPENRPLSAKQLLPHFNISRLPRQDIRISACGLTAHI